MSASSVSPRPPHASSAGLLSPSADPLSGLCQRADADPAARPGLSLWCTLLHLSQLYAGRSPRMELVGGPGPQLKAQLRLWVGGADRALLLDSASPDGLSEWLDGRFDHVLHQGTPPPADALTRTGQLLNIEALVHAWPAPSAGRWCRQDAESVAEALHSSHRLPEPPFLRTAFRVLAREWTAWARTLPPRPEPEAQPARPHAAEKRWVAFFKEGPQAGQRRHQLGQALQAALSLPQPSGAGLPRAASVSPPPSPSPTISSAETAPEELPPSPPGKSAKQKKKARQKAKARAKAPEAPRPTPPPMGTDVPRLVAQLARTWSRGCHAQQDGANAADRNRDREMVIGGLLGASTRPDREETWRAAIGAAEEVHRGHGWLLLAEMRAAGVPVPPPALVSAALPLGAPDAPEARAEANASLWDLARQNERLPQVSDACEPGLTSLIVHNDTRLAALALAARIALTVQGEGRLPLTSLAEQHKIEVTAAYARALRRDSSEVAGLLPLLALAFHRLPPQEVAKHLLPLSEHGHLAKDEVVQRLALVCLRLPATLLFLPLPEPAWRRAGQLALTLSSPQVLDALPAALEPPERRGLKDVLTAASRLLKTIGLGNAEQVQLSLGRIFSTPRSPHEVDLLLAICGTALCEAVDMVGDAQANGSPEVQAALLQSFEGWGSALRQIYRCDTGPAQPPGRPFVGTAANAWTVGASSARGMLRHALCQRAFFARWLGHILQPRDETLSVENERFERRVLAPYLMAAVNTVVHAPSLDPADLVKLFCQSGPLRHAWTFSLVGKWPVPGADDIDGERVMPCDAQDNLRAIQRAIPDTLAFAPVHYATKRMTPLVVDWLENCIFAASNAFGDGQPLDGELEQALWYRVAAALLAIARRNAFEPWSLGEAAIERLTLLFRALPTDVQRLWAARLCGLARAQQKSAFFRPDEPEGRPAEDPHGTAHLCIEHLLPPVVAMCRAAPGDMSGTLANAYMDLAAASTRNFRARDACGQPQRLQWRTIEALAEFLPRAAPTAGARATDREQAAAAFCLQVGLWLRPLLEAPRNNGFEAEDRLLSAARQRLTEWVHADRACALLETVLTEALADFLTPAPLDDHEDMESLRVALMHVRYYIEQQATWLGDRPRGPIVSRLAMRLPQAVAALLETEARAEDQVEGLAQVNRLLYQLLENSADEPFLRRLQALASYEGPAEPMITLMFRYRAEVASLMTLPSSLKQTSDWIEGLDRAGRADSCLQQALAPAIALAAQWLSEWFEAMGAEELSIDVAGLERANAHIGLGRSPRPGNR